jgi:hypothetical protein
MRYYWLLLAEGHHTRQHFGSMVAEGGGVSAAERVANRALRSHPAQGQVLVARAVGGGKQAKADCPTTLLATQPRPGRAEFDKRGRLV